MLQRLAGGLPGKENGGLELFDFQPRRLAGQGRCNQRFRPHCDWYKQEKGSQYCSDADAFFHIHLPRLSLSALDDF